MEKENLNSSLPIFFSKTCSLLFIFQPFLSRSSLAFSKEYMSVSFFERAPNVPAGSGGKKALRHNPSAHRLLFFSVNG